MADKISVSERFKLFWDDYLKGFVIAVGTPVIYLIQELIPGWDAHPIVKASISATITYLLKNFFAKPSVTTVYDTNAKAINVAEDIKETNK